VLQQQQHCRGSCWSGVWAAVLSVYLAEHLPSAYVWCGEGKGHALLSERERAEKTNDHYQSPLVVERSSKSGVCMHMRMHVQTGSC
jgi:hypothetical protein